MIKDSHYSRENTTSKYLEMMESFLGSIDLLNVTRTITDIESY
jgi:hypothetical protein